MPDEEKVWSNEKIVNSDVICGLTKKMCSVPSLPRYTWGKRGVYKLYVQCTLDLYIMHTTHHVVQILKFYETSLIINKILMYSTSVSLLLNGQLKL